LTVTQVRSELQEKNLSSVGNKLEIKKLLNQFDNFDSENNSLLLDDNIKNLDEKLKPGFALKSNQKYGKKGGKKFDLNVIERLKSMFLASNIEKSKPEDMLKKLQKLVENNELKAKNIPSLQQIKSWITQFS